MMRMIGSTLIRALAHPSSIPGETSFETIRHRHKMYSYKCIKAAMRTYSTLSIHKLSIDSDNSHIEETPSP